MRDISRSPQYDFMEEGKEKSGAGRILSVLFLLLLLVGMPFGSYIYLKRGYDYQKAALDDMRRSERFTNYQNLQAVVGEPLLEQIGTTTIVGLLGGQSTTTDQTYIEVLNRLYEQFEALSNVQFWTVMPERDSSYIAQYAAQLETKEEGAQVLYFRSDNYASLVRQLHLSEEEFAYLNDHPMMVLVDDSLYVRRAYRVDIPEDIKVLVERTALLAPERSRPKPELVRETEK